MRRAQASKTDIASGIIAALETTPLDDLATIRRYHFQIGNVPEHGAEAVYQRTVRAALRLKLGLRSSAGEDLSIALKGRFSAPPELLSNICRVLAMMGRFDEAATVAREILDNEDAMTPEIVYTLTAFGVSSGELGIIERVARAGGELGATLADSLLKVLDEGRLREAFSHRQKAIHRLVDGKLCDIDSMYDTDAEGFRRIRCEYWLAAGYDECEAITQSVWAEMDRYFDARGESGDPLSPVAPFIIKELPAYDASNA